MYNPSTHSLSLAPMALSHIRVGQSFAFDILPLPTNPFTSSAIVLAVAAIDPYISRSYRSAEASLFSAEQKDKTASTMHCRELLLRALRSHLSDLSSHLPAWMLIASYAIEPRLAVGAQNASGPPAADNSPIPASEGKVTRSPRAGAQNASGPPAANSPIPASEGRG